MGVNMNKKDLSDYRTKLFRLDANEIKQRDLYLRKIAVGELLGPVTGYPTIDKTHFKFMTEEDILTEQPVKNVYQELYDNNYEYPSQTALIFFGNRISFRSFFRNIDNVAKALVSNGVKNGDFITIMSVTVPEAVYIFYACAKLGVVADFMNPLLTKGRKERIIGCGSKIAVVLDKFYSSVIQDVRAAGIEKIVILPTLNSSFLGLVSKKIKLDKDYNEVSWNSFIKEGKGEKVPQTVCYEKEMPLVAVSSSGSTGFPKSILLTHDSFENSVHAYPRCDVKISRNDLYYQIIPPWFSTGISTSVHLPLTYGGTLYMDPRFDREVFVKNNLRLNPTGTIAPASMFQGFLDENILPQKGNLSNYKVCFQGGEKVEMKDKLSIEEVFKRYNSEAKLMNGYGQCECGAGIATQTQNTPANVTAGIPIPGVTIMIVDDNRQEVIEGTRGEILVNTPCSMKEYFNDSEATEKYFYYDENGTKWNCTGDVGFIDSDGELTVEGRMNDYSIVAGQKIYNFDIEDIIRRLDYIQNCDVFTDNTGMLVAHIILKEDRIQQEKEFTIKDIQKAIMKSRGNKNYIPKKYKFRTEFPNSATGKRDVAAMKAETEGFISADNAS